MALALLASSLCGAANDGADDSTHYNAADPARTRPALTFLLGASNEPIPPKSSCHGDYGQSGPARVKDLLSMQLAYVYQGSSVIKGSCSEGANPRCELSITRAAGEDVSQAKIAFAVRQGKVLPRSLHCEITP